MNCSICGKELDSEEIESPRKDKAGRIICDECFDDKYTHHCPICEEHFDEDFTKKISPKYLLISDCAAEAMYINSGIYEITKYPFFREGMIEISMIETALDRIAHLPKDFDEDEFFSDIFYVCEECGKKQLTAGSDP